VASSVAENNQCVALSINIVIDYWELEELAFIPCKRAHL
jgi:hypothetical protein